MTSRFLAEILEQPDALRRSIDSYPTNRPDLSKLINEVKGHQYRQIILTGMGSSLHSCYPLWLTINAHLNTPAIMWDSSELIHYAPNLIDENTLLIAISQSGESAEVKAATELAAQPGVSLSVTNGLENSLALWATINLDTQAGEEATVSTKTYTTTLAVLALLADQILGKNTSHTRTQLQQATDELDVFLTNWETILDQMANFLGRCETLAYIGRGPSIASVRTSALITKESSKIFCLGLSAGQFRHGPLELARLGFKSVIFAGDKRTRALNERLANDIASYGGHCLLITPQPNKTLSSPNLLQIPIPNATSNLLPIFEIVPIELLTIRLAEANGFEPATFDHASKITSKE